MAIKLQNVTLNDSFTLFRLLKERQKWQSISHKAMPTMQQHLNFIRSKPYLHWWTIWKDGILLGAGYITNANEIGIMLFKEYTGLGHGARIVNKMLEAAGPGNYLANINPENKHSIRFFKKLGFNHIQNTYAKKTG